MTYRIVIISFLLTLALMIGTCIARGQVHCDPCPPVVFLPVVHVTEVSE